MPAFVSRFAVTLALAAATALPMAASASASELMITDPTSWFSSNQPVELDRRVPTCHDAAVEKAVGDHIADAIPSYYDGLKVQAIEEIRQSALGVEPGSVLARRYCVARLTLSAQPKEPPIHDVAYFMVEEKAGFVGLSWNVEVCMAGRDKWHVYDGACRTVRPSPAQ